MPQHLVRERQQLLDLLQRQPAPGSQEEHELDRQTRSVAKEG
jgi:hypothetical protein